MDWLFGIAAVCVMLLTRLISHRLKRYLQARWASRGVKGEITAEAVQVFLYLEAAIAYFFAYFLLAGAPRSLLPAVLGFAAITPVAGAMAVLLALSFYYLSRLLQTRRTSIT